MAGANPGVVTIPALYTSLLTNLAQKGLTILFTWLLAHGILAAGQQTQFVEIGGGLILGGASLVWTYISTHLRHQRQLALAAQPPPTVIAK